MNIKLADAQLIVAREHGFESWPKFKKHLQSVWRVAERAIIGGDVATLERLLGEHETMFREQRPPSFGTGGLRPSYSGGDAPSILARNHHFDRWDEFGRRNKTFEAAVDAVVSGSEATLGRLLHQNPDLIQARSTRQHRSTLLHYVGANGVEYFRQRTPKNAVAILEMLLHAGAEVDAEAKMYGGSTTLGLVSTSIHPLLAGVQDTLIETLLKHGSVIRDGDVFACLANGRGEAAELLAQRGARLDLATAAGVGRFDLVKSWMPAASQEQLKEAFTWACAYGRTTIVDLLLDNGVEVNARLRQHRETGLHRAALGGHVEIVKLLLDRKAPINIQDETFGGTPLGWALHAASQKESGRYDEVVALLRGDSQR